MIPVDVRGRVAPIQSDASELVLRKTLAIARGNLARIKALRDIEQLGAWSARAGRTAQVASLIWAVTTSVAALRRPSQPGATKLTVLPTLLGLLGGWLSPRQGIHRDR